MFKSLIFIFLLCLINNGYADTNPTNEEVLVEGFYLNSFPDVTLADMDVVLRYWTGEIGQQLGIPTSMILYNSIDNMRADFDQGKINFIVASPLTIINHFDLDYLVGGYKVVFPDLQEEKLLIVTHTESGLDDFNKLKNKQLSLLKNEPVSKLYADVLALQNFSRKAEQVFSIINDKLKSHQLILKLFFKKTDAIIVYEHSYDLAIELNPQIKLKTQVIAALNNVPRALGFFHKRVSSKFRETVIAEMKKLHQYPRGQQVLTLFLAEKLERSSILDLKTVQELQHTYLKLLNYTQNR